MAAKIFEVGDVLPATTQLRISWINHERLNDDISHYIKTNFNFIAFEDDSPYFRYFRIRSPSTSLYYVTDYDSFIANDCTYIVDTSLWTEQERTVTVVEEELSMYTWEDLNTPSGYSITFEENGGTSVTDLTEQTALPSPLPTTTKENHVFAGWYYDNLFTQKANAGDELTANVTLYAKWYTPTTWCEDIADAIREKEGSSGSIKHVDFADRIRELEGAKPEETKTVTPNFASGNVVVTPTSGKVMTQVTVNKDTTNHKAENIKKDITLYGITGNSFIAIELTQAQYDALTTPDTNTYYIVVEEE